MDGLGERLLDRNLDTEFEQRSSGIDQGQGGGQLVHRGRVQHHPIQQSNVFWDNGRWWPKNILSMLCCVLLLSAVAFICSFLYLILKDLRAERIIEADGSEIRLLGFWSVLVLSVLAGVSCCSLSWTLTYFDSYEPGMHPSTPLSTAPLRRLTGHSYHVGYSMAVLNGIVAALTVIWSLV